MKDEPWTPEMIERLRALWADPAMSYTAIARALGVSQNAINSKRKRLCLPTRGPPICAGFAKPSKAKPLRPGASTLPPLRSLSDA
jgi:hypothetical protein